MQDWHIQEHNISSNPEKPMMVYEVIGPKMAFPHLRPGFLLSDRKEAEAIARAGEIRLNCEHFDTNMPQNRDMC